MSLDDAIPPEVLREEPPVSDDEIDGYMARQDEDDARPWSAADHEEAEYAMARYSQISHELGDISDQAMAIHQKVAAWQDRMERRLTGRLAYFEYVLIEFARQWHDEDPRGRKTLDLVSGKVKIIQHKAGTVVVDDESVVLAWLQDHPEGESAVKRVDPYVLLPGLRKIVKAVQVGGGEWQAVDDETGRPVPGAKAEAPDPDSYKVVTG